MELFASKETYTLLRGVDELKRMFPDCLQRDMISHCARGYDMVKIKDDLNIQDPEPEILDQTSLTGAVFRSN